MGLPVATRSVSAEETRHTDEVFLTSTAGGILPVTRVDGRLLGDGQPAPITWKLLEQYWALHQDPRYSSPIASCLLRL